MKKITLLIVTVACLIGCANQKRKMLIGQWEFQNVKIQSTSDIDTSQKGQMASFVDQLVLQTIDFNFKNDDTFETIKRKEVDEKGKFQIKGKKLTLEYSTGKEVEYDDFEILAITDTTMQLRNAGNMIIAYKKIKK